MSGDLWRADGAVELTPAEAPRLLPLFADRPTWQIARSCCEGLVPCRAFADRTDRPAAAVVVLRRMGIAFVAGDASHAPALLHALRGWHPWYEVNDPPDAWQPALAAWTRESHATVRYAFASDPHQFDGACLRALAAPPEGFVLRPYDRALLDEALSQPWSEDQTGAFETPEAFLREGMGMALLREGRLVSGCASFCRHADGYEIQVDTHPDLRGQGLAACVSAAFMLRALALGRTPHWDAANAISLRLAEKLGFRFTRAYAAWLLITPAQRPEAVIERVVGTNETER